MNVLHPHARPAQAERAEARTSAFPVEGLDAAWLHDMRNAVNSVSLSAAVAKSLVEHNEPERAAVLLQELERACARCRELMAALHLA